MLSSWLQAGLKEINTTVHWLHSNTLRLSISAQIGMQARQRAELNATEADSKLKAVIWANDSSTSSSDKKQNQTLADVDASLMQRLDQESSNNHRLLEAIKAAQVGYRMLTYHVSL